MKKKALSLLLVAAMALSLAACSSSSSDSTADDTSADATETADTESDTESDDEELSYDETSALLYEEALGDFYTAYEAAEEADSVSERYALMAIAEAYLLESGVTLPTTTAGGYPTITRVAPYTITTVMWGTDTYRFHNAVVTNEIISAEDYETMSAKWAELRGTGTYEEWVKEYLLENGYTLDDNYGYGSYTEDPATWDVLSTSLAVDCEAIVNTYDGLLEYDSENELQPALATSYEVSEDGLTYTFYIREGVSWVDSQGREVDTVTADDFVAGFQHMLDSAGGLEYLVEGVILNASEYIYGEITDFSEVGVEAVDDYTLVYTLEEPCSYFLTMLGYSVFAPMSRDYYESLGGKFGSEYDASASDYTYGTDPDHIAYCGPYLVTSYTESNKIVFSANDSYWNAENINISTITWIYEDGSDATKKYNDFLDGTLSETSLNTSAYALATSDGNWDLYGVVSPTDSTTYQIYYNINRAAFANYNDGTAVASSKSDEEAERATAALQNQNFRLAISFATDRATYNEQSAGEAQAETSLRNTITPGNFVSLEEDVTVEINGVETTFEAGTYYGAIVQAQLDADEFPATVWDPDANDGVGSSDGYDGWYDPDTAVAYLEAAIEELAEEGITIDEDNPIYLDLPCVSSVETYANKANAYKQSIESALGGLVIINLTDCTDMNDWYYAAYMPSYGYEENYDISDCSGWVADYGDPNTYLSCFLPDYSGYMTKTLGIY